MESRLDDSCRNRNSEDSHAMALFYATNTRLKFERVYKSARKAILAGEVQTAIRKCRAALDLLDERDIYGESQPALRQLLEEQLERMTKQPEPPPVTVPRPRMIVDVTELTENEPERLVM